MPRVRWADLDVDAAVAAVHEPLPPPADAWGEEDGSDAAAVGAAAPQQAHQHRSTLPVAERQQQQPMVPPPQRHRQQHQPQPQQQQQQPKQHQQPAPLPSLLQLCMAVLGQHVAALVADLGDSCRYLPADAKAALLAVARRRQELSGDMLQCLADESWTHLDVAGCRQLCGAELLAAAPRLSGITSVDLTGVERLSAGGWRRLAAALPRLRCVRLGGSEACSQEALKVLPHILPGLPQPAAAAAATTTAAAAADSWEDAFASSDDDHDGSSGGGGSSSLKHLQALVWPDVPPEAVALIQQRCPRVSINPPFKPDRWGAPPPAAFDAATPLDAPSMALVGPGWMAGAALRASGPQQQQQQLGPGELSIAERFKDAYLQRHRRLLAIDKRLRAAEERKQLRASHALRVIEGFLDEE